VGVELWQRRLLASLVRRTYGAVRLLSKQQVMLLAASVSKPTAVGRYRVAVFTDSERVRFKSGTALACISEREDSLHRRLLGYVEPFT